VRFYETKHSNGDHEGIVVQDDYAAYSRGANEGAGMWECRTPVDFLPMRVAGFESESYYKVYIRLDRTV
jgi:hypothetical protein